MQENWLEIAAQFDVKKSYVLAVIVATEGATYRKAGTMMLIDQQQQYAGLLSGGCLEADIALHAEPIFNSEQTKLLRYDLTTDADLLWGLGLGCEGKIDILLLPLHRGNDYLGFEELVERVMSQQRGRYWILLPSRNEMAEGDGLKHPAKAFFSAAIDDLSPAQTGNWLSIPVTPPISVAVIGAGPDAVPVVNMAVQMGWKVSLFDHRENALNRSDFDVNTNNTKFSRTKVRAENASTALFNGFDAAIVMTHNLTNDQCFCQTLLATNVEYIGLLGPQARRDKILSALNTNIDEVNGRIFGPVGLDLGGRSPQAIALSILAEVQQQVSLRLKHHHYQSAQCHFE